MRENATVWTGTPYFLDRGSGDGQKSGASGISKAIDGILNGAENFQVF